MGAAAANLPADNPLADLGADRSGGYGSLSNLEPMLNMIGDQGPSPFLQQFRLRPAQTQIPSPFPPPTLPNAPPADRRRFIPAIAPSVRSFKISENQSPQPQDRVYFSFNYYANVNGDLNRRLNSPVDQFRAYREIFGFEKTFNEGLGSICVRLPLYTLSADFAANANGRRQASTSTALGDLTICGKYTLALDPETGSLLSAGLAVTPPTGPGTFAGVPYLSGFRTTAIQPFLGYIWRRGKFFLHGFTAIDVPCSSRDATLLYNDLGAGYEVFRNADASAFLTAVIPTFEVHVNNPLNHRDYLSVNDPFAIPDVVNLTSGLNLLVRQSSTLTFGIVTPVTGPRPFDYEALLLLNIRFGRSRSAQIPPLLGG
ncbi:MAG: hypothetical protein ABS79_07320 [Planctomycetes bacterium SCN 63-9]|nr:MAG: hypothetical protein ABS79_07320 [Planctomycetes bacterium SCN 63-9]